ncbi:YbgC/YbaW family acyl-CoA thioester hydrolase [Bradyrhizobium sp. USDA 3240]
MQVRVYFKISTPCQIVYHTNFLRFIERGRTNYLRPLGTNQQGRLEETRNDAPGFAFVVRSTTIDSLKPAFLDGLHDIVTVPQEVRGTSVGLPQECRRGDDLLVSARGRVSFISGGKAQRIPRSEACYGRAQINLPFDHALIAPMKSMHWPSAATSSSQSSPERHVAQGSQSNWVTVLVVALLYATIIAIAASFTAAKLLEGNSSICRRAGSRRRAGRRIRAFTEGVNHHRPAVPTHCILCVVIVDKCCPLGFL